MTARPLYETLIEQGWIDWRHEITMMRFAACNRAAQKVGKDNCKPEDQRYLISQYGCIRKHIVYFLIDELEFLLEPAPEGFDFLELSTLLLLSPNCINEWLERIGNFFDCNYPAQYQRTP